MTEPPEALIITRRDIARIMTPADYRNAAEQAFAAVAAGKAGTPSPMHLPMTRGGFHAKGATISTDGEYVAVKVNGNFPGNPAELGLPTIQGAIVLADGRTGALLAILDSAEVTLRRTAAASAVAARLLARPDSATLLICGCGEQGRAHLAALAEVLPVERALLWDVAVERAGALAAELSGRGIEPAAVHDLRSAARSADVIVTCTTATKPFLGPDMVNPGTFIAAVGADDPAKHEVAPDLMAASVVVTDSTAQCAVMGDLHHAIAAGAMTRGDVRAELADIISGKARPRGSPDETIVFDSTGTGVQDVAAAAAIYRRCAAAGIGQAVALAARDQP
ncbi:MAG TPA: ornithine cyclodeaminase family protein [Sphingomicrobium sp.]|nr:ornithine cyclodeaminase family protein [Sphingomicrobium sp.]